MASPVSDGDDPSVQMISPAWHKKSAAVLSPARSVPGITEGTLKLMLERGLATPFGPAGS